VYQDLDHVEEAIQASGRFGFDAADLYITKQNPKEQELYLVMERARTPPSRQTPLRV